VGDRTTREKLRAGLPDIPKWLETRWMLSLETTEVTGLDAAPAPADALTGADPITTLITSILNPAGALKQGSGGVVVRDPPTGLISVIGDPPHEVIRAAVDASERPDVVAQVENADRVEKALPELPRTTAKLHWLVDSERLLGPLVPPTNMLGLPEVDTREDADPLSALERPEFLLTAEVTELTGAPDNLKRELTIAVLRGPVVGVRVDGRPVSFCHAEIQTERLWDVAIETLEGFRGKGHAVKAVEQLARHMLDVYNKRPVWGALETNEPSLRLASKLGFRPIDEVVVFETK
jgi:hypothetical protein